MNLATALGRYSAMPRTRPVAGDLVPGRDPCIRETWTWDVFVPPSATMPGSVISPEQALSLSSAPLESFTNGTFVPQPS